MSSRPMRPRLVNMVELTGDLGISSSPLTANMERTWAAAWFQSKRSFTYTIVFIELTLALIVRVVGSGFSIVSHS